MTQHSVRKLKNTEETRLTPKGIHTGMDITIQNISSSAYVYIGGEGVTASSFGYRLNPGSAISFELPGKDSLHAISDTNESEIAILRTNLEAGY
jgi:hypothetical protein